jgi:hypothetical protein
MKGAWASSRVVMRACSCFFSDDPGGDLLFGFSKPLTSESFGGKGGFGGSGGGLSRKGMALDPRVRVKPGGGC